MATRRVTATVLNPDGSPAAGGVVTFRLVKGSYTAQAQYPAGDVNCVLSAQGEIRGHDGASQTPAGVALWCEDEGLVQTRYECYLPGETKPSSKFNLAYGDGSDIPLSTLRAAGGTTTAPGDPAYVVMQSLVAAHASVVAAPGVLGHIKGGGAGYSIDPDGTLQVPVVSQEVVQDYLSAFFNSTTPALHATYNDPQNRVDLSIDLATHLLDGLMSAADKVSFDAIPSTYATQSALAAEASARSSADAALQAAINSLSSNLASEASSRAAADSSLSSAIAAEAAARSAAISGLSSVYQPLNSDLSAIAALTPTNNDIVQRKAGAWVNRTPAQFKSDLALVKGDVGLSNVDNTSDANKPVSTVQQAALDLKAPLANPALTGTPTAPTAANATSSTQIATTAFVHACITDLINAAPAALDTLGEIAAQLASDESAVGALTTTVAGKLAKSANLSDLPNAATAQANLFGTQSANVVYAGPSSGAAANPAFRALVYADIPALDAAKISNFNTSVDARITNAAVVAAIGYTPGTVSSVALTVPGVLFSVAGSPITGSGTLAFSLLTQTANTVLAGPTSGAAAAPTMRALVAADIPDLSATYPLLAGKVGGQSITGGTGAGESLTLQSTSNATKGKIFFGANSAYDGANTRLGIGTTSPAAALEVTGTMRVTGNGSAPSTGAGMHFQYDSVGGVADVSTYDYGASAFKKQRWNASQYSFLIAGSEKLTLDTNGLVGVNKSSSIGAQLHVVAKDASTKGLIVQAAASPTANLQEWQDSTGAAKAFVDKAGTVVVNRGTSYSVNSSDTIVSNAGANTDRLLTFALNNTAYWHWNLFGAGTGNLNFVETGVADFRLALKRGGGVAVNIDPNSMNAAALMQLESTTKGFLPPRMTNAQMLAIASPPEGLVAYDLTNHHLNYYNGTTWVAF